MLDEEGDPAFARLRIDADDRFVSLTEVCGVDREVWHFPDLFFAPRARKSMTFPLVLETFFDGILMRAGESGVDQFPGVRVPWMHRQIIALGDNVDDMLNVVKFDVRVDTLRIIVQCEIDEVDIPCALPISEEATFDAVTSCKNAKFSCGDASPCVQRLGYSRRKEPWYMPLSL